MAGLFGDVAGYTPEDDKRALLLAALTGGLGLLGVRRRHAGEDLSRVGLGALGTYMGAQDDAQRRMMHQLQTQNLLMDTATKKREFDRADQLDTALRNYQPPTPMGQAMSQAPSLSPTQQNVAQVTANAGAIQQGTGEYERLIGIAKYLEGKGLAKDALAYYAQAEKYAPQYGDTETLMQGGNPVVVQKFKNRPLQTVQGYEPKPDISLQDTGGGIEAIDRLRVKPGQSWQKTLTPGEVQTGELGRGNLAVAQGNLAVNQSELGLKRNADARAAQQLEQGKWTNDIERGLQINMATGQTRPMTAEGQPIGMKKDAKAEENLAKARAVVEQAEPIIKEATGSYFGAGVDLGARAFGKATTGAIAIGKLKTLEAALMLSQPRMEGQQSNLDVQMYREAAGQIGDPTIPREQKLQALKTIRGLQDKYSSIHKGGGRDFAPTADPLGIR